MSHASDRIAALEARIAELERSRQPSTRRFPRLPRRLAAIALAVALVLPTGGALASHQFSDVPTSHQFHNSIDAIADAGITTGCGGGRYCPNGLVTRGQMAAFINRLGALAPGSAPKVNALRLNGHRMSSGTVAYSGGPRRLMLRDAATAAEVYITASGFIEVVNTDATRRLAIAGMSIVSTIVETESANLAPGESATFNTQTLHSRYLDLALTLAGPTASQTRFSNLFCALADVGGGPPAYQSCIATGRG
jgi:hypothetical protein